MRKDEIAHNEQFSSFPTMFLLNQKIAIPFVNIFDIISLLAAEVEEPRIDMRGNGLTQGHPPMLRMQVRITKR